MTTIIVLLCIIIGIENKHNKMVRNQIDTIYYKIFVSNYRSLATGTELHAHLPPIKPNSVFGHPKKKAL